MDRFSSLPAELRLKIFSFTGLVIRDRSGRKAEVHVHNGKFANPVAHFMYWHKASTCDCPENLPAELLDQRNNPYYAEILEVVFSQNRIVLGGYLDKTLTFLRMHGQATRHIRKLEFQLDDYLIDEWTECNNAHQIEWEELFVYVRQNLNLSNLTLSLNAGHAVPIYEDQHFEEIEEGDFRLDAYKMIIKPLRGLGEMGRLKRFYVFWGCYHEYEAEAEREVMGASYQPMNKIPISRRAPDDPYCDYIEESERIQKEEQNQAARFKDE